MRTHTGWLLAIGLLLSSSGLCVEKPNILWISAEDINPDLGCYGDTYATTPALDRFAESGMIYKHCWSNAGSCAPARTTIITGVYPPSAGAEHMRSLVPISPSIRMFPQFLREQGYYCVNPGKTDYNLTMPQGKVWDAPPGPAHWRKAPPGHPFFAVFNLTHSHESQMVRAQGKKTIHDPARVQLAPYYPDIPEVRQDWARYHDNITTMDRAFADILQQLEDDGLADNTIVFFFGDNGGGMPAHKHSARNAGLHVPLIVRVPPRWQSYAGGGYRAGTTTDRLVSFVDFAPTMLSLAGIPAPTWMQGQAFLGPHEAAPNEYLHGFRGRAGSRIDLVRCIRDRRFIYIRNYMPHLPRLRRNYYHGTPASMGAWEDLFLAGKLTPDQARPWDPRPAEELYDLEKDPHEIHNLANHPAHTETLIRLRDAQRAHLAAIHDIGFLPEAEMHARAAGGAPYDLARDPARYAFDRIFAMAEAAGEGGVPARQKCREGLRDPDSAVRYWAATGLLIKGPDAVRGAQAELLAALTDVSPVVRIAAAHALGTYGDDDQRTHALRTLEQDVSHTKNGLYVCMAALNAAEMLVEKDTPLLDALRALPDKAPAHEERPGQALGWTKNGIVKNAGVSRPPAPSVEK